METNRYKLQENVSSIAFFSIVAFVFSTLSPLHLWTNSFCSGDSSVFKTVSMMMKMGYMPYKDSFDHKGPMLYLLNYLGDCIAPYRGIWVIEFCFLTAAFFMIYKTARLFVKEKTSIIVTFISISLLFDYYQAGNYTEEYAMTFIAISLFIFIDYFKNSNINRCRLIICGASFAGTLLLRPNMISLWIVMCFAVLIKTIKDRFWKNFYYLFLFFIIGTIGVLAPIIIWLSMNGALKQFWLDYIVFNMKYSSTDSVTFLMHSRWSSFFFFFNSTIYMAAFFLQIYHCKKEKNIFNYAYLVYMIMTLVFICLSGAQYVHYGMILIPIVSYPLAYMISRIENSECIELRDIVLVMMGVFVISNNILPDWVDLVQNLPTIYNERDEEHIPQVMLDICDEVDRLGVDAYDKISVYGNWNEMYILLGRPHATRYSYQFPIGQIDSRIMDEYFMELYDEMPKVIIVENTHYDERMENFVKSNAYHFVWGENETVEAGGALVFSRNSLDNKK